MKPKNRVHSALMLFALVAATSVISAPAAQGQSTSLGAQIPFAFHAANTVLPPGSYEITPIGSSVIKIQNRATHEFALLITNPIGESQPHSGSSVTFNRYGAEYFLSDVFWDGYRTGQRPLRSESERQLAQSAKPSRVVAAARAQ